MATQVIIDRQYAGKYDAKPILVTVSIEVAPCSNVITEVDASCKKLSAQSRK